MYTTNYPGAPLQPSAQGNEVEEVYPGRIFYVSTDQDGNFRVGEYFRIDQATGRATLNASAFDLAGLTSLKLGSIGAQLGETINEFSSDVTLSGNSNAAVPTEYAVKQYVDTSFNTYNTYMRANVAIAAFLKSQPKEIASAAKLTQTWSRAQNVAVANGLVTSATVGNYNVSNIVYVTIPSAPAVGNTLITIVGNVSIWANVVSVANALTTGFITANVITGYRETYSGFTQNISVTYTTSTANSISSIVTS